MSRVRYDPATVTGRPARRGTTGRVEASADVSGPADGRPRLPRRVALRKALPAGLLLLPLALGVATLLGGGASAAPADEAAAARAALGELKSSEQSALSELTSVSAKLEAARTYEAELAAKVERQRAALADKRRELASVRKNQAAAQELLTERLQYWYRTGGVDIVEVVLGASSIDEALGQIDALRRISSQDARIVGETRDAAAKARRAAADLARVEAELEQAQKDAAQDAQWLASVQSEKQALVARLRREQGLTAQRIDRLEAAAAAAAAAAEDGLRHPPTTAARAAAATAAAPETAAAAPATTAAARGTTAAAPGTTAAARGTTAGTAATAAAPAAGARCRPR